jgi:inorganic pyrophosphatase
MKNCYKFPGFPVDNAETCEYFVNNKILTKYIMTTRVYIEIEKFSNQKYEFNKNTDQLELDRVLPYPYFYPYAYGFIPNTLAMDGDDLDALIITNKPLSKGETYDAQIIGVLIMEDEKGLDEKIICVLPEDYIHIKEVIDLSSKDLSDIHWFFTNYKNNTPGKWSKVIGYDSRERAVDLFNAYSILA